ncbi:Syntaxin-2 [Entamoeba marina]
MSQVNGPCKLNKEKVRLLSSSNSSFYGGSTSFHLPESLNDFMKTINDLKKILIDIEDTTSRLELKHCCMTRLVQRHMIESEGDEMRQYIDKICQDALKVQQCLERLRSENDDYENKIQSGDKTININETEIRIRKNHVANLSKCFVRVMKESREIQEVVNRDLTMYLVKQVNNYDPSINKQSIVQPDDKKWQSAQQQLKMELTKKLDKTESLQVLAYVKNRHDEVLSISKSIDKLTKTFVDAAILVQMQGELINNIIHNCSTAKNYTQRATQIIQKSGTLKKKHRFMVAAISITTCLIGTILLFLIAIVVVPIILKAAKIALVA